MIIEVVTPITAPMTRCFDAARDIDLHLRSLAHTGESVVAGRMHGLIELGESVTWRGRHFGVMQELTSTISRLEFPTYFRDEMVKGAFASFVHDHYFIESAEVTTMRDVVEFRAPLGILGAIVDRLVLKRYLQRLIAERALVIKAAVES